MTLFDEIRTYCKAKRIPVYKFEFECGLGNGTVSRWKNDKCKPSRESLRRLSEVLDLPYDYLISLL